MKKERNAHTSLILWGIPIMFILGGLFHSFYDFTGNQFILGLFFPVNESIFEHIKIAVMPVLIWWTVVYFIKKDEIEIDEWFFSALLSMVISAILVPMLYYFYTGTFGVHLMWVDILILLVALGIGQLVAAHFYKYGEAFDYKISIAIMIFIIVLLAYWTINPPYLPIFKDGQSGTYGIYRTIP